MISGPFFSVDLNSELDLKVFLADSFVHLTTFTNLLKEEKDNSVDKFDISQSCHEGKGPVPLFQIGRNNPELYICIQIFRLIVTRPVELKKVNFVLAEKNFVLKREIRCS